MNDDSLSAANIGMKHKTISHYLIGITACIIFTLIPFSMVYYQMASKAMTLLIVVVCAIIQFITQVIYFLGLTFKSEQGKLNIFSFIFSIFILTVVVCGSIWIMYHLDYNMMH